MAFDWSRHGSYANTLEDVTSYVTKNKHISVSWGRSDTSATTDSEAGKLEVDLRNTGRQFSSENASSPIAGKVVPGTKGRLNVTHPITGATTTLFSGPLDTFTVDPNSAEKTFSASLLDGWGVPGAEALSTAVYTGMRTGDLIGVVLDSIGWPSAARDLDPGATIVPYWWEDGNDAATAVQRIVASEGPPAIAYVKGGIFYFRDRFHRITRAASTTSQGTFTHIKPAGTGPAGDYKMLRGTFAYDHGWNIANSVTFSVARRTPGAQAAVWTTDTPISLGAGETQTLIVHTDDPFMAAVTPVLNTDYTLASGTVTVSVSRDSGQTVFITLTAGGGGALINGGFQLRANPLAVDSTLQVQVEDASSVGTFTRRKWDGEVPWAGYGDATAIARRIVATYGQPRPSITFSFAVSPAMRAADYSRYLTKVLGLAISDRITVRNDEMGINADFMVEHLAHDIQQLGVIHTVQVYCQVPEPTQPSNVFTFDTAGKGFNDGLFGVDGIDSATNIFQFDVAGHGFTDGFFGN